MNEQQKHLVNLIQQQQDIIAQINSIQNELVSKRELFLRVQGAIDYLQRIGTKLPDLSEKNDSNKSNKEEFQDLNSFMSKEQMEKLDKYAEYLSESH